MSADTEKAVLICYTNWRGETSLRKVTPHSWRHGTTQWHPEPQWLMKAFDKDKGEYREFAMEDIKAWVPVAP